MTSKYHQVYALVHGDTIDDDETVVKNIIGHFINVRPNEGEIVAITHSALDQVPYFHSREDWTVIVDEVLSVSAAGTITCQTPIILQPSI